jgi:hypothetical protein
MLVEGLQISAANSAANSAAAPARVRKFRCRQEWSFCLQINDFKQVSMLKGRFLAGPPDFFPAVREE